LGLVPFVVLRIVQQDWPTAILNVTAVLFTSSLFLHVLLTKNTRHAKAGLAFLTILVMVATIHLKGANNVAWVYPALSTTFYLLPPVIAATVSLVSLSIVVVLIYESVNAVFLLTFLISAAATLAFLYAFSSRTQKQALFLEKLATSDSLTEVGNRRSLEEKLLEITQRIGRAPEQTSSLIIFDIDHFKRINDTLGHQAGDAVLKSVAALLKAALPRHATLSRFGGEEFALWLAEDGPTACSLAESLRQMLQDHRAEWKENDLAICASFGVAQMRPGKRQESTQLLFDKVFARADRALFKAKADGRNRVVYTD
jgi:diguanylate cyclase (GGDEF)-like protein